MVVQYLVIRLVHIQSIKNKAVIHPTLDIIFTGTLLKTSTYSNHEIIL